VAEIPTLPEPEALWAAPTVARRLLLALYDDDEIEDKRAELRRAGSPLQQGLGAVDPRRPGPSCGTCDH